LPDPSARSRSPAPHPRGSANRCEMTERTSAGMEPVTGTGPPTATPIRCLRAQADVLARMPNRNAPSPALKSSEILDAGGLSGNSGARGRGVPRQQLLSKTRKVGNLRQWPTLPQRFWTRPPRGFPSTAINVARRWGSPAVAARVATALARPSSAGCSGNYSPAGGPTAAGAHVRAPSWASRNRNEPR
jgi:hypothetical protein